MKGVSGRSSSKNELVALLFFKKLFIILEQKLLFCFFDYKKHVFICQVFLQKNVFFFWKKYVMFKKHILFGKCFRKAFSLTKTIFFVEFTSLLVNRAKKQELFTTFHLALSICPNIVLLTRVFSTVFNFNFYPSKIFILNNHIRFLFFSSV